MTKIVSEIEWPNGRRDAFGNWLAKLRGQRSDGKNGTALMCLNHLNLSHVILILNDLYCANLTGAYLTEASITGAYLRGAYLRGAKLDNAIMPEGFEMQ